MWEGDFVFPLFIAIGMVSFMSARGLLRLFGMALAVFCLIVPLLPSQKVEATAACSIRPISDDFWNGGAHTDGVNVVWLSARYDTEVHLFFHHVASDTTTEVYRTDDGTMGGAYLDGEYIVWTLGDGKSSASEEIYFHNLQTHTTLNISNTPDKFDGEAVIQGNYIVWEGDGEVNSATDIYLYDLTTGQKRNLSQSATFDDHYPKIDGRYIVWYGIDRENNYSQIFVYDLISDSQITLTDEPLFYDYYPEIYGTRVVWERGDGQDFEVFMHDLVTHQTTNVSQNVNASDDLPQIYGSRIIWMSTSNSTREFYSFDIQTNQKQKLPAIDGGTVFPPQMFDSYTVWEANGKVYLDDGETVQYLDDQDGYDDWDPYIHSNFITWQSYGTIFMATCGEAELPAITDQPDDVTIEDGETVTLSVSATGSGPLTYQWYIEGYPIYSAKSNTYTITEARYTAQYQVKVTSPFGSVDSQSATVRVIIPSHPSSLFANCQIEQVSIDRGDSYQTDGKYIVWVDQWWQLHQYEIATGITYQLSDSDEKFADFPQIDNGKIVWEGKPSPSYRLGMTGNDIYLYDLIAKTTINISNSEHYDDHRPHIDGSNIVWYRDNSIEAAVFHFDLLTGTTTQISQTDGQNNILLDLEGNLVLWFSGTGFNSSYDLHLHDLETGITTKLTDTPNIRVYSSPQLYHGRVVWNDLNNRIYIYDVLTKTKTELSIYGANPSLSENRVVWVQRLGGGYGQIYQYDIKTKITSPLYTTPSEIDSDEVFAVSNHWVVWSDIASRLYFHDGVKLHLITDSSTFLDHTVKISENILIWKGHPLNMHYWGSGRFGYLFMAKCEGAAPTITDQPDSLTINANETVTLVVTAIGDGSLGYQWYTGNAGDTSNPIPDATSASYTTPALSANASYWVRVNGTFGSADSTTAIISVQQTLPPTEVTPSPTTETPVPTTETPVATTETPPTEVTPSPTTETPVPSTEVPPTAITVPPTATTAPTINLLANGGFEVDADGDKLPDSWKGKKTTIASADKLKCDKADKTFAYNGTCAFMFKGNPDGSTSKLLQKVSDTSVFVHGATVTLSTWIDPRSAPVGTKFAQAKIVYSDGSKSTLKLSIPAAGSYIQQADSVLLDLTGKSVKSVKVDLRYDGAKGKFFVDDVMLTIEAGVMSLPLP